VAKAQCCWVHARSICLGCPSCQYAEGAALSLAVMLVLTCNRLLRTFGRGYVTCSLGVWFCHVFNALVDAGAALSWVLVNICTKACVQYFKELLCISRRQKDVVLFMSLFSGLTTCFVYILNLNKLAGK
jgi:hypothetical protein